jgi:hypothetical protein
MFNIKTNNDVAFSNSFAERRDAAESERREREMERQKYLSAQSSPQYDPQRRIRLWEHLHAMHLPGDPDHSLIRVIAKQTALTVKQVHDEQLRRIAETQQAAIPKSSA